jgi:DNA gyrase subunit B
VRQRAFRLVQGGGFPRRQGLLTWSSSGVTTTRSSRSSAKQKGTGTLITFKPDATIFTITTEFKFDDLANRLRELAFLNPGVEITPHRRARTEKAERFFYKDGIEEFVGSSASNKQVLHPKPITIGNRQARTKEEVFVDCVLQYNDSYNDQILCFANSIPTRTAART